MTGDQWAIVANAAATIILTITLVIHTGRRH